MMYIYKGIFLIIKKYLELVLLVRIEIYDILLYGKLGNKIIYKI